MVPPHGESRLAEAIAVLGAETPLGARVRAALEAAAIPNDRVDLFRSSDGEPTLSEDGGEARLIQRPDPDVVGSHGIVFDCGVDGSDAQSGSDATTVLRLDLTGGSGAPLANRRLQSTAGERRGTLAIPLALAVVVLDLLEPLHRGPGFERVSVTILRPAGDAGDAGVEELRLQVTGMMSFSDVPTGTLGRRLAFNCYPEAPGAPSARGDADRVADEVRELLGVERAAVAVRILCVPVFFGHGISIHVVPRAGVATDEIDEAWTGADRHAAGDDR